MERIQLRHGLKIDGLVCDLDGVLYRGDAPISGAVDTLTALRDGGTRLVLCTNNSRATPALVAAKLAGFGFEARPDEVLTSAVVTGETLASQGWGGHSAIVVGGEGIRQALRDAGIRVEEDPTTTTADLVVVGWDPRFTYDDMRRAALAVRAGAELIATNDDAAYPAVDGLWPGAGAILASIEVGSGRRAAAVMGKPHDPMMDAAARRLDGCAHIAIVGDRPETDLAGGRARGWTTVLVLSGVTSEDEARLVDPSPDIVLDDLTALVDRGREDPA